MAKTDKKVQEREVTPALKNYTSTVVNVVRLGEMKKDTTVKFKDKEAVIPKGTISKRIQQKDLASLLGIAPTTLAYRLRKSGLKWVDVVWGNTYLPGGTFNYICNLVEKVGLGWTAISEHLEKLGVYQTPTNIHHYYKRKKGIYDHVPNDYESGTYAVHLVHIARPKAGYLWPVRYTKSPGIYMSARAHHAMDRAARELWISNGLIYALYGDGETGNGKLTGGNAAWIVNDYRKRFGNKGEKAVCKAAGLNKECLKTFTPAPVATA